MLKRQEWMEKASQAEQQHVKIPGAWRRVTREEVDLG